jgi:hypothetical protein
MNRNTALNKNGLASLLCGYDPCFIGIDSYTHPVYSVDGGNETWDGFEHLNPNVVLCS